MRASHRARRYRQDSQHGRQHFHNSVWLTGGWISTVVLLVACLFTAWQALTGTDPSLWWWAGGYGAGALINLALNRLVVE